MKYRNTSMTIDYKDNKRFSDPYYTLWNKLEPSTGIDNLDIKSFNNILFELTGLFENKNISQEEYSYLIKMLLSHFMEEKYSLFEENISNSVEKYMKQIESFLDRMDDFID